MKHLKFVKGILAAVCAVSLAGCGGIQKDAGMETPSCSRNQTQDGADNEAEDLLASSVLTGTVTDFQNGSFQVAADQTKDNGQTAVNAAPGMEEEGGVENVTVSYTVDCIFQTADIDSGTGAVDLEDASAAEVKKSTEVAVFGEKQEDGGIRAEKLLITRFQ